MLLRMIRRDLFWLPVFTCFLFACSQGSVSSPEPLLPIPSQAQLQWHEMEMNAFVHFTVNTFTNKEWGYGDESPALFNPTATDIDQWLSVFSEAGFKGLILTCKHHDGFCLWPSRYTEHDISNSPYNNGNGDIVKEVADACRRYGLKFGIYLSPWDRNHPDYGTPEYLTYYRNQLTELFERYGPVFEMWFDGANGGDGYYGGANETRHITGATYYDWPTTLNLVQKMEPEVLFFSDAGPGVRWVGNERGEAGETNWNMLTPDTLFAGKIGIENLLNTGSEDGTQWIPAETNVSIRPGWFYHEREDSLVKSPERLFELYLTSVGRGSTLLLNIPPDKRGRIHENDVASLRGFREILNTEFKTNIAASAKSGASATRGDDPAYASENVLDGNPDTYWTLDDGETSGVLELRWKDMHELKYIILHEYVKLGQRVKTFQVEAHINDEWTRIAEGTTIGYKRILQISSVTTDHIRVAIKEARECPLISELEVY